MRVLHTSDWHVGKALRGRSRATEHEAVLAEIAGIAQREAVDVVIVAGDLFDSATPTPEAERIVYRGLLDLAEGDRPVIVVAGNHDCDERDDMLAGWRSCHFRPSATSSRPTCCSRAMPPTPTPPMPIA